jgi:hypothetical protein
VGADKFMPQNWIDSTAQAARVTMVATDGTSTGTPGVARTKSLTRVNTATTTSITAGKKSYTVIVVAAASAASPTLDGVALPAGVSLTFSVISNNDTLPSASLVTLAGDDVLIASLT